MKPPRKALLCLFATGTLALAGCDNGNDSPEKSGPDSSAAGTTSPEASSSPETTESTNAGPNPTMPISPAAGPGTADSGQPDDQTASGSSGNVDAGQGDHDSQAQLPAPAPGGAPDYGVPCSASQAAQPATGSDGSALVCTNMGGAAGYAWVYGPEPMGAGTASDGAACVDGEQGGQDTQGRVMLCSNGQWVYGP